jgi:hypothetical protein
MSFWTTSSRLWPTSAVKRSRRPQPGKLFVSVFAFEGTQSDTLKRYRDLGVARVVRSRRDVWQTHSAVSRPVRPGQLDIA